MTPEQKKFHDLKKTTDYKTVGDDIDYKVFIDEDAESVVLQYEESDSRADWRNNLLFIPWPLRLDNKIVWTTLGYSRAYRSAANVPLDEFTTVCNACPGYKRVIRGWSFGSAMAKISARHWTIRNKDLALSELTTYGDVKCWVNPFYSIKKHVSLLHEYTCINDGVTWCVPVFWRDKTSRVGPGFSIREILRSDYYHTHYDEYDYSKYEK